MDAPRKHLVSHDRRLEDHEAKLRWFLGLTIEERLFYADGVMALLPARAKGLTGGEDPDGTPVTARVVRLPRAP